MKKPRKPRPRKATKLNAVVAAPLPAAISPPIKKIFRWVGYVLAVLAVFGGIQDFFELADLVRAVTWKWDYWNHRLWATIFGYDPDNFPLGFSTRLTFLLALIIIGFAALSAEEKIKPRPRDTFWSVIRRELFEHFKFPQAFAIAFLSMLVVNSAIDKLIFNSNSIIYTYEKPELAALGLEPIRKEVESKESVVIPLC